MNKKKKRNEKGEALAPGAILPIRFQHFSTLDGYRVKFNAISRYIIPIILSRVIAH